MISHTNLNGLLIRENHLKYPPYAVQVRSFFAWLNHIFNKVDTGMFKFKYINRCLKLDLHCWNVARLPL